MKKLLLSATVVAGLFAAPTIESLQKQINELQQQLKELKAKQDSQNDRYYKKVAPIVSNDHVFWRADLRTSIDFINYKMTDGSKKHNNIIANRFQLTGVAKPADNLKFNFIIQANNLYGMNNTQQNAPYTNISWVVNETPDDTNIRVKEAYFNYWFGENNEYMFSAGRRPATYGFPANLRDNERAESPLAHLINMEFDGFSLQFTNDAMPESLQDYGTWIKFCAGRGFSSAKGFGNIAAYSRENALKNTDFAGFIIVPYDNGQYALWTETVFAKNMKGFATPADAANGKMSDLGDYFGFNAVFKADGVGDGISDFLDDTKAFISFALSKTKPDSGKTMLGSADNETGHSIWIGADMPAGEDGDRFGFNFVKGSKYWRNMTYGEDTLVGSIAAVRGKAYEIYYHHNIQENLTAGLRATYIKYDYTGSNGFFGLSGMPQDIDDAANDVKEVSDIRAYIRYNF